MFVALVVAAAVSVPVVVVAVVAAVAVASAENKLHKTFFVDSTKKRSFIKKQQLKFRFHFETRFISFFSFTRHCATHDEFVTTNTAFVTTNRSVTSFKIVSIALECDNLWQ